MRPASVMCACAAITSLSGRTKRSWWVGRIGAYHVEVIAFFAYDPVFADAPIAILSVLVPMTSTPLPKRILFVCVENSNRSQLAEAFARIHGGEHVETYSAGSKPSVVVNPRALEAMRELGYDLSGHASKSLDDFPTDRQWDFVATMDCGDACPTLRARRREDWNLPDSKKHVAARISPSA